MRPRYTVSLCACSLVYAHLDLQPRDLMSSSAGFSFLGYYHRRVSISLLFSRWARFRYFRRCASIDAAMLYREGLLRDLHSARAAADGPDA